MKRTILPPPNPNFIRDDLRAERRSGLARVEEGFDDGSSFEYGVVERHPIGDFESRAEKAALEVA